MHRQKVPCRHRKLIQICYPFPLRCNLYVSIRISIYNTVDGAEGFIILQKLILIPIIFFEAGEHLNNCQLSLSIYEHVKASCFHTFYRHDCCMRPSEYYHYILIFLPQFLCKPKSPEIIRGQCRYSDHSRLYFQHLMHKARDCIIIHNSIYQTYCIPFFSCICCKVCNSKRWQITSYFAHLLSIPFAD